MMTPPLLEHNVIATNLQTLLNAALRTYDDSRYAARRPGVDCPWPPAILAGMEKNGGDTSVPDVAVVEYGAILDPVRFTDTAYRLAEVVSRTDADLTPIRGERWIDGKVRLYRAHTPCQAIIVAQQERVCVMVYSRGVQDGWVVQALTGLDAALEIPSAGLSCRVGDLYRDTRWRPRTPRA